MKTEFEELEGILKRLHVLSRRDLFIAAALEGLVAHGDADYEDLTTDGHLVQRAVRMADEVVAQVPNPA